MEVEFWQSFLAKNAAEEPPRPLLVTDPLFARCNETKFGLASRANFDDENPFMYLVSSDEDDDEASPRKLGVECQYSCCTKMFATTFEAEDHFNSCHAFACAECRRCFPCEHLLDLHVSENHDVFFKVKAEKEPMVRFARNIVFQINLYQRWMMNTNYKIVIFGFDLWTRRRKDFL
jgi:hypothetical protein